MTAWGELSVGRIPVVGVEPVLEQGRWPVKATVGEAVRVRATVFREGHDAEGATAVLTAPDGSHTPVPMECVNPGLGLWEASLIPAMEGAHTFRVEGWSNPVGTWAHAAEVKVRAGIDVQLMLDEGVAVLTRARDEVPRSRAEAAVVTAAIAALADSALAPDVRLARAWSPELRDLLRRAPLRDWVSPSPDYPLTVERERALVSSWYEMFPRSEGATRVARTGAWKSGTFTTAAKRLPGIAAMGFDVVYLTPIHPIGLTHRKGRNNSLTCEEGDPGSPYAIGSPDGGHDALHPELGTMRQFRAFVAKAREVGLEVALDVALQCSPDHPWVTQHPEWFTHRADGTIAYAENPPKKYQDIYPLNFDNDPEGIYTAVRDVLVLWVEAGVTLFRVDNPHTKPLTFWERLLAEFARDYPQVVFLAEAFTRPPMMHTLAKIGFHQSYTYFTWRRTAAEMAEYLQEVSGPASYYMRPNFWPTTHDILTPDMQTGGPAHWKMRAALAATGSPSWGIYSGFEFVESVPRPGAEEHIDNEKYEFKPRPWANADEHGMVTLLTRLNQVRREHVALQRLRGLTVHSSTNDQVLCFTRHVSAAESPTGVADTVVVVASFDAHTSQESTITLDLNALGLPDDAVLAVTDAITGERYTWGREFYVRLTPGHTLIHVATVDAD